MTTPPRILVIGLDGATWDLLAPWMDSGKLPCLRRLRDEGATAFLQSTIPPITPVAWSTFMTGKNPGCTGIFDFFSPPRRNYTDLVPVSAKVKGEPSLWGILSRRGRHVGVINMPMTYPPEKVNGFLISGVPAPSQPDQAYPQSILAELQARGWDLTRNAAVVEDSYERYLEYLSDLVATRIEATKYLLNAKEWDAFFVHFLETDQVQHTYWRFTDVKAVDGAPHPLSGAMLRVFQQVDRGIAEILGLLDEGVAVMLMSDHGMGPTVGHVYLNNWLLQEGFMKWRRNVVTWCRRLGYSVGLNPASLHGIMPASLLRRFTLGDLRAGLAGVSTEHVGRRRSRFRQFTNWLLRLPLLSFADVDWNRTVAYASGPTQTGFIYINLRGREPRGIVAPGAEYEEVRGVLQQRLMEMINPLTGDLMVERVCQGEELYSGPRLQDAPDLVVTYRDGRFDSKHGAIFWSTRLIESIKSANASHRATGILMMWKPGVIVSQQRIPEAHLRDLAPTLLYLMDEAVPSDMEGRELLEAFTEAYRDAHPPQVEEVLPQDLTDQTADEIGLTSEEQSVILEQLRNLGYL